MKKLVRFLFVGILFGPSMACGTDAEIETAEQRFVLARQAIIQAGNIPNNIFTSYDEMCDAMEKPSYNDKVFSYGNALNTYTNSLENASEIGLNLRAQYQEAMIDYEARFNRRD